MAAILGYVIPSGMTPILLHKMAIVCNLMLLAVCDSSFGHFYQLKEHNESFHVNHEKKFECKNCDSSFGNFNEQVGHEKTFKCKMCNFCFENLNQLKKHVKSIHDKKFQCNICDSSFGYFYQLKEHNESIHVNHLRT